MEVSVVEWISLFVLVSEVVLRAIPNEKAKGLIGYGIDVLKVISDFLNRREKESDRLSRR
jgi:hypothetical protein